MTQRYIQLGLGRRIGLGAYVRAWKQCRQLPPKTWIGPGISGYGETAEQALRELRRGMDDRINRHTKGYGVGRKWDWDWQRDADDLAWKLNNRIVIHWMRPEFKARFAEHLNGGETW